MDSQNEKQAFGLRIEVNLPNNAVLLRGSCNDAGVESKIKHGDAALTAFRATGDVASIRPAMSFLEQIDVVLPSRAARDGAFTSLKTTYSTAQFTLSELYEYASRLAIPTVPFKAFPVQCDADDTWCIDPRGILTLSVSKLLYEQLGLVGKRVPFKGCMERYVIHVPLKRDTTSVGMQARQKAALGIWDGVRASEGLGKWHVAYVTADGPSALTSTAQLQEVTTRVRRQTNIYIPHIGDLTPATEGADIGEDDRERLEALFEWVGMACLGAQRLRGNDRVDPYVAVYEAPSPSSIGEIVHLRWKGLMDSTFVRSVIDTAISVSSMSEPDGDDNSFVSITLHSNPMTPVACVPESPAKDAPFRVPGPEAEDTICLILSGSTSKSTWAMGESIGQWDARWG